MFVCVITQDPALAERFSLHIIPIDDDLFDDLAVQKLIGTEVDCITIPYDSKVWYDNYSTFKLGKDVFKLAVPLTSEYGSKTSSPLKNRGL